MAPNPPWPPELDGVVAAPDHHSILFENDAVRVVETIVEPATPPRSTPIRRPSYTWYQGHISSAKTTPAA